MAKIFLCIINVSEFMSFLEVLKVEWPYGG